MVIILTRRGASGGGGHTIEDEGIPLTQRTDLNFVGGGVTVTDAGGKTQVSIGGGGTTHDVLSATHPDSVPATVLRGALICGQSATPLWTLLALGASGQIPISDGTDLVYRALLAADIPNLAASKITSGTIATARLGSGTADATTFLRGDQTYAVPPTGGSGEYTAVKSTAEITVNNSTTPVSVTGMTFAVSANTIYEGYVVCVGESVAAADMKIVISVPAGTGGAAGTSGLQNTVTSLTSNLSEATNGSYVNYFPFIAEVGGTAGNIAITFAQLSADVSDTKLYKNSIMFIREVDTP